MGGRKGIQPTKTEWLVAGVVMCLGQDTDFHMAQLMPLPFTISCSSKSRLVLPFWCQLTLVIPDKIQEGHKTVVCACVCVFNQLHNIDTHTHTQPFYSSLDFVWDNPGELVPKGTFCHLLDFLVHNIDTCNKNITHIIYICNKRPHEHRVLTK